MPARGPDVYRNFVVPLNLDRDTWVRAIDFRPSARSVVHHSLFFLDATGASRERDASDPLPGFPGGMGGGRVVGAGRGWRRSGRACSAGAAAATRSTTIRWLASRAVLEAGRLAAERSSCRRAWRSSSPRDPISILSTHFIRPARSSARSRPSVCTSHRRRRRRPSRRSSCRRYSACSKGSTYRLTKAHYMIKDSFVIPIDVRAFSVGAHAHYLGKQMRLTATLPDGEVKTLLRIDDWDFSWQERYRFAEFVSLPKGTRLDAEVSYDNTVANKRNPSRPPVRVTWGEESTDEMGSIGLPGRGRVARGAAAAAAGAFWRTCVRRRLRVQACGSCCGAGSAR